MKTVKTWCNKNEKQLIKALESSSIILMLDTNGKISYSNKIFHSLSGFDQNYLNKKSLFSLCKKNKLEKIISQFNKKETNTAIWNENVCLKTSENNDLYVKLSIIPIKNKKNIIKKYTVIGNDITKQKKRELKYKKLKTDFYNIFNNANDAIFIFDKENDSIIDLNEKAYTSFGYTKDELQTTSFFNLISKNNLLNSKYKLDTLLENENIIFEAELLNKDNHITDVEISCKQFKHENKNIFQAIVRDISERKKTHQKLKEKTLELETFLYRAGHDLKAPLTTLEGLLNLLLLENLNKNAREVCNMIESTLRNGKILIENLTTASHMLGKPKRKEKTNLREIINQTLINLKHNEGFNNIDFKLNIPNKVCIYTNPLLLISIFQNLIQNAIKYQRPKTKSHKPSINIDVTEVDNNVNIIVIDNGIGIKKEEIDNIFNLYYRSTTAVDGSGLGLYITKNAIELLNGIITVSSELNRKTQFNITIPKNPNK